MLPCPNYNFVVDGENSDSVTHVYGEGNTVNVMEWRLVKATTLRKRRRPVKATWR